VDAIIDALTGSQNGALIERLFTILDATAPLDDHISGYFEKVQQSPPITVTNHGF
jgi:hypothetical protein